MKKQFFSLMIGAVVALASCSKSDEAPNLPLLGEQNATFNIEAPTTRATVTGLTRYIVEAYEGKNLTTTPVRTESATGSLTLELKKNTEYTFVFWADNGTANTAIATSGDYYDATSLQDVKVSPAAYPTVATPAYCLAVSFNSKDFEANKTVVLKNATAQLNFTESAGLVTASNSLTVKYSSGGKLNVATGKVTEIGLEISRTYTNIGMIAKDGIVATDYILAPLGEKRLLDLKMTFNSEPEKAITAVPFQQNYKTSVKGEFSNMYSSVFTVSDKVNDYENNPGVEFPIKAKVGDFYYKDKTFSSTYAENAANPCIGIVFWVDPMNDKKGKIVGVTEETGKYWSTGLAITGATSADDGAANTDKVLAMSDFSITAYPAFAFVKSQNDANTVAGIKWYLPAKDELYALYGTGGVTLSLVITSLNIAHKTILSYDNYWSSTEVSNGVASFFNLDTGYMSGYSKDANQLRVRVISAF